VDAAAVALQIPRRLDVDGCHWQGQMLLAGGQGAVARGERDLLANAPVTPAAVMHLLDEYRVCVRGRPVLVVGRSKLVGAPLAFMLGARGGLVTTAHSQTAQKQLREACRVADVVVACAGYPGLLRGDWIQPGAVVVNVGTTFVDGRLLPDIPSQPEELAHARLVASCPNGIGPLSIAVLLKQTAANALARTPKPTGAEGTTPTLAPPHLAEWLRANPSWRLAPRALGAGSAPEVLTCTFHLPSYPGAVAFVATVSEDAERVNHHPNVSFIHSCTQGVDVTVEFFTYAVKGITSFDTAAAERVHAIHGAYATAYMLAAKL